MKLTRLLPYYCRLSFTLLAPSFEGSLEGFFLKKVKAFATKQIQFTRRGGTLVYPEPRGACSACPEPRRERILRRVAKTPKQLL